MRIYTYSRASRYTCTRTHVPAAVLCMYCSPINNNIQCIYYSLTIIIILTEFLSLSLPRTHYQTGQSDCTLLATCTTVPSHLEGYRVPGLPFVEYCRKEFPSFRLIGQEIFSSCTLAAKHPSQVNTLNCTP